MRDRFSPTCGVRSLRQRAASWRNSGPRFSRHRRDRQRNSRRRPAGCGIAGAHFTAPVGLLFNTVRPERVADFEKRDRIPAGGAGEERGCEVTGRRRRAGACSRPQSRDRADGAVRVRVRSRPWQGRTTGSGRILAEALSDQAQLQEIWKLYTDSLASGGSLLNLTPRQGPRAARTDEVEAVCFGLVCAGRTRRYGHAEDALEFQVRSNVKPLHRCRASGIALQREHAVVDARPQRTDQRDLHAAAGVDAEDRLAEVPKAFLVHPAAGREVRLEARDRDRRLEQHVAHAGAQSRRRLGEIFDVFAVLELESDDEQAGAEREATVPAVGW